MTRKDYILIARVLNQFLHASSFVEKLTPKEAVKTIIIDFSIALKKDNQRFDLVKFEKACGLDS